MDEARPPRMCLHHPEKLARRRGLCWRCYGVFRACGVPLPPMSAPGPEAWPLEFRLLAWASSLPEASRAALHAATDPRRVGDHRTNRDETGRLTTAQRHGESRPSAAPTAEDLVVQLASGDEAVAQAAARRILDAVGLTEAPVRRVIEA